MTDGLEEYEQVEVEALPASVEFVSQIESVKKAKELLFEPAPGFGKYRMYYPKSDGKNPDAVAHPAKMSTPFCEYLITRYTQVGDTILDPMSGAGTTAVVGAPLGRNVVTVELEQKFVDWQNGMKAKIEEAPMLMKGEITVIKGDARKLTELIGVVDAEVSSPPYSASLRKKNRNVKDLDRLLKAGYSEKWIKQHHDQPNQNIAISGQGYSKDPNNIGNLAHGQIDAVLTSPPYGEANEGGGIARKGYEGKFGKDEKLQERHDRKFSKDPENISNLKFDSIITSPPYAESLGKSRKGYTTDPQLARTRQYGQDTSDGNIGNLKMEKAEAKMPKRKNGVRTPARAAYFGDYGTGTDPANLGSLPIDGIITSPPYEGSEAFMDTDFVKKISPDIEARTLKYKSGGHVSQHHSASPEAEQRYLDKAEKGRISHPDSLGKLVKENYLSAMKRVYGEMYSVLKPGGVAVIVVKAFQRNKRVVDLPWQTWLLLHACGFEFEDVVKLRLPNLSFWRILMYRKNPALERIVHEYALIVRRPANS